MRGTPRTAHINVRMTQEERADIVARSARFGMPPSTFMRESALQRDTEPVRVASADELRTLRTDLKRIGNLLNQALRIAHTYGLDRSTQELIEGSIHRASDAAALISSLLLKATERR